MLENLFIIDAFAQKHGGGGGTKGGKTGERGNQKLSITNRPNINKRSFTPKIRGNQNLIKNNMRKKYS